MSEIILTDQNFDEETEKAGVSMVDFFATWCGPCKMLAPVIEELAKEYAGKVRVYKADIEQAIETTNRFKISSVPTLIFFKDGQEKARVLGAVAKSEIKKQLDALL